MMSFRLLGVLALLNVAPAEQPPEIPAVSSCELYARPERFDGRFVEVTGRINVQFESMSLVCLDEKIEEAPLLFGIWLRLDFDAIKERSPQFSRELEDGYRAARKWKGGLIGDMRFRGHFRLSSEWEPAWDGTAPRQRFGFGHLGMYGAEIVVEEVLSYRSVLEKPNQISEVSKQAGK